MRRLSVVLTALVLVACTPEASPTVSPTRSPVGGRGSILWGTSWKLVSIGGVHLPAGVGVSLDLTPDEASGRSGCNHYAGSYTVDGRAITFGPMSVTRMACPEPLMSVERAYLAALASATTWAIPVDAPVAIELAISGPDPAKKLVFASP